MKEIRQSLKQEDEKMTDKELRQLKRTELIEMLYYMKTEIDELKAENEQLEI